MAKYFMIAPSFVFILCFLQGSTADKISCQVGENNAIQNVTKACDYCTYIEVEHSFNVTTLPNGIQRACVNGTDPKLTYFSNNQTNYFQAINVCTTFKDNDQTYKCQICDKDFCNEKCENGAISLSFSVIGMFLSILIPLKLA